MFWKNRKAISTADSFFLLIVGIIIVVVVVWKTNPTISTVTDGLFP